ncbi:MAG: class I SAM-dependent methyltransferase [Candidatus Peribacteraceae bacterium]|nr:class I SAM-dependent methyltransferase [Candidatus Peribacteraceae bacterium]
MPVDIVDYSFREATMRCDTRGWWQRLTKPFWDEVFHEWVHTVFHKKGTIIDIGGGLRIDPTRSDRVDPVRQVLFNKYLHQEGMSYKTTDYTAQYKPDYVEDIHKLSFADNSIDGLFCLAVLEHVYDPKRAAEEIVRVLKKGGKALMYVPYIYRYHAHQNDYRDYFRYSKDGISYLFRDCASVEICPVRGIFETLLRFLPLHTVGIFRGAARLLDVSIPALRRISQKQTSGYNILMTK